MRINIRFDDTLTIASPGLADGLCAIATALNRIAVAQERIATAMEPTLARKATSVALSNIQAEPLASPPEEPMSQFKIGLEGCKAKLVFNGKIDGEPTLSVVGSSAVMTADPKVEVTTPDTTDPSHFVDTEVTLHFKNDGTLPAGVFGVTGSAQADDPETGDVEMVPIDFPEVGEYIPQTQAKANTVSLSTESEPL